jgi:hypothetical protein
MKSRDTGMWLAGCVASLVVGIVCGRLAFPTRHALEGQWSGLHREGGSELITVDFGSSGKMRLSRYSDIRRSNLVSDTEFAGSFVDEGGYVTIEHIEEHHDGSIRRISSDWVKFMLGGKAMLIHGEISSLIKDPRQVGLYDVLVRGESLSVEEFAELVECQ